MSAGDHIFKFFWPKLTPWFFIRLGCLILGSYILFGHVVRPMHISGHSMHPTYRDGQVNFCFLWKYRSSAPLAGDVVMVRFTGNSTMYLKRVVAVAGQTVAFKRGKLLIDGQVQDEPYVKLSCDWELPPRKVRLGNVYVIGDNRSVPIENHDFGQTSLSQVAGAPVW